jgi:hypothetical protein
MRTLIIIYIKIGLIYSFIIKLKLKLIFMLTLIDMRIINIIKKKLLMIEKSNY